MRFPKATLTMGLAASLALPFGYEADAAQPAKTRKLMEEMITAASKAGALKRKLTNEIPAAKKRFQKIQELRQEISEINDEIDEILVGKSRKYQTLLQKKEELAAKYQAAKDADEDSQ